jgi:hypothetical protein
MAAVGPGGKSAVAIEPLLAAVESTGIVAAGSGAMEGVFVSMEDRLDAVVERAEGEVREINRAAWRRTDSTVAEARREIARLRTTLVERAGDLARTYDSLIGLLDAAERELDGLTDAAATR